ncbi:signal recognition particle 9 kDa protein-domain-containing protein [Daldinia bambusicola]|nr:signal recognition particle 9 kDa protein-domain-containing protein [Daldinia bambusicola]
MPYYATSQEWLHQSSLLLEAQPTTTRITTKYHISKPKPRRSKKSSPSTTTTTTAPPSETIATTTTAAPRGSLTLKTYDPYSGVCLKYRTTKAAEVSRLIQSLGRPLGARMAALPLPEAADEVMADAPLAQAEEDAVVPAGTAAKGQGQGQAQGQAQTQAQGQGGAGTGGGGGGGKGKKKRGKK